MKDFFDCGQELAQFKCGIYHHLPAIGAPNFSQLNRYWSQGLSEGILDYLEAHSVNLDPAMHHILTKARPYWMSDLLQAEELSSEADKYKIIIALKYVGDGILLPVYGPFQKRGYIFIGFENPREFFDEIFIWQIQALLQLVHIRYCVIIESLRKSVKLTSRESEVLELITFGKTNPEIGLILGIKATTVTGHVKNIFLKLNTKDRVTTALRAQSFSL